MTGMTFDERGGNSMFIFHTNYFKPAKRYEQLPVEGNSPIIVLQGVLGQASLGEVLCLSMN